MGQLVGAAVRGGVSVWDALRVEDWRSMSTHASGGGSADGTAESTSLNERFILSAPAGQTNSMDGGCLAYAGMIAMGQHELGSIHRELRSQPPGPPALDGHFAAAFTKGNDLWLLRSISGGERLYFFVSDSLVLFASSIRTLWAHPGVPQRLAMDRLTDGLLTGHPMAGSQTFFEGVREVMPGYGLRVSIGDGASAGGVSTAECPPPKQYLVRPAALQSPLGSPSRLARGYAEALGETVRSASGGKLPVAVALSGGIDSSAVAAAAVAAYGAKDVVALTYEFDDESHPVETHFAKRVVARLGIRQHIIFKISFKSFLDAIPEHVWRSESPVHWPKAFLLPVARQIKQLGFAQYLTGFGIGSHMGFLSELSTVWPLVSRLGPAVWQRLRFDSWDWLLALERVHPGLVPPHPRLYQMLVALSHLGSQDPHRYYPSEMAPMLSGRPDWTEVDQATAGLPLARRLQLLAIAHSISCIDVTRSEKASREVGARRVSPAHFFRTLPYSYFPMDPPPPLWSKSRLQRPGKYLLQRAYRGVLPDEVLFRQKSWADAVTSRAWRKRGRVFMLRALPQFPFDLAAVHRDLPSAVEHWEPTSILASSLSFRFFQHLMLERSIDDPAPTWDELIPNFADTANAADTNSSG